MVAVRVAARCLSNYKAEGVLREAEEVALDSEVELQACSLKE